MPTGMPALLAAVSLIPFLSCAITPPRLYQRQQGGGHGPLRLYSRTARRPRLRRALLVLRPRRRTGHRGTAGGPGPRRHGAGGGRLRLAGAGEPGGPDHRQGALPRRLGQPGYPGGGPSAVRRRGAPGARRPAGPAAQHRTGWLRPRIEHAMLAPSLANSGTGSPAGPTRKNPQEASMARATARHILVDSKEKCEALKAEIEGGRDFAEVARENSSCPSSRQDRKSTRLNSSHVRISYAVFCLKKKKK